MSGQRRTTHGWANCWTTNCWTTDCWTTLRFVRRALRLGESYHNKPRRLASLLTTIILICQISITLAQDNSSVRDVKIVSTADRTAQPAKIFVPKTNPTEPIPLLVVLHSWSADYTQKNPFLPCLAACQQRKWAMVHPDFRGPNVRPQACGSDLAVQDVLDAVDFMKQHAKIDPTRIYLVGTSGGGHMSLLMAGRAPDVWAGVSAWVPISDVAAWHAERTVRGGENDRYRIHMQQVCGGAPGSSAAVDQQYRHRSPLTWLKKAVNIPIDINTGIHDGHTGSVPIGQSLKAFNLLAKTAGKPQQTLTTQHIQFMTVQRKIPKDLASETVQEDGRIRPVVFRRKSGRSRVTIFEGGHEGDMPTAIRWLAKQRKVNK